MNSGLRRARAQLAQALPAEDELAEPAEPDRRALLDRFAAAIEGADGSALAELLREDVALEMPPVLTWFTGRQAVAGFIAAHFLTEPGGLRLVPVMANGERAFAVYQREPGGAYHAHAVLVPTVTATGIARIIAFQDQGLFGSFGLPQEYGAGSGPAPRRTRRSAGPGRGLDCSNQLSVTRSPAPPRDSGRAAKTLKSPGRPRRLPGIRLVYISGPPDERRGTPQEHRRAGGTDMTINGKTVLVTGANRGIGQALVTEALALERENAAFVAAEPAAA